MELQNKKYIPVYKQSKKAQRENAASRRSVVGFNAGTRIHKTDKHPSRARAKCLARNLHDIE